MLVVLFFVVMYTDGRWLRIPNAVTYPTMLVGLVLGALEAFPGTLFGTGLIDHLAGLVLAFGLSYPFYAARGLKAGDAKLLMAIGAVGGTSFLLVSTVWGALIGGVLAVGFIAVRRFRARGSAEGDMSKVMKSSMPYGIALALGGLVAVALQATGMIMVGPA